MPIKICTGSHGGIKNMCQKCKHDMSHNHEDFKGTLREPEGKYGFLDTHICTLVQPYWSQFEAKEITH